MLSIFSLSALLPDRLLTQPLLESQRDGRENRMLYEGGRGGAKQYIDSAHPYTNALICIVNELCSVLCSVVARGVWGDSDAMQSGESRHRERFLQLITGVFTVKILRATINGWLAGRRIESSR